MPQNLSDIFKTLSDEEMQELSKMTPKARQNRIEVLMQAQEFQEAPEVDPFNINDKLDLVEQAAIHPFELDFGEAAPFSARLWASFGDTAKKKVQILESQGWKARALPNGMVVIVDEANNQVRPLDEAGISRGDIADAGGAFLPTVGGTLGAAAGLVSGGPAAPVTMGVFGASGAAIGQGVNELIAANMGALTPPKEVATNILSEGLVDGLFSFAPGGGGMLLKHLSKSKTFVPHINPFLKTVNKDAVAVRKLFQREGGDLIPTSLNTHRAIQLARTRGSVDSFASEVWREDELAARETLDRIVQRFSTEIADKVPPDEAGNFAKSAFDVSNKFFFVERDMRFDAIGRKMSGHRVFAAETVDAMKEVFGRVGLIDEKTGKVVDKLPPLVDRKWKGVIDRYKQLTKPGATHTYSNLKILKAVINDAIPQSKDNISTGTEAGLKKIASAVHEDMLGNVKRVAQLTKDEDLLREVAETNAWYSKQLALRNGVVAKKIANSSPEKIMGLIYRKDNITEMRELKELMGMTPHYVNFLSRQWLDRVVQDHTDTAGNLVLKGFTKKVRGVGDEMLREMFPESYDQLQEILRAADVLDQGLTRAGVAMSENAIGRALNMIIRPFSEIPRTLGNRGIAEVLASKSGKDFLAGGKEIPDAMSTPMQKILEAIRQKTPAAADKLQIGGLAGPILTEIFNADDTQSPPRR